MFCCDTNPTAYNKFYSDEDGLEGIGSFFAKIGKIAAPIAASFIPVVGPVASAGVEALMSRVGNGSKKLKGMSGVQQAGNEVLGQLESLKSRVQNGEITAGQAGVEADKLVALLSDKNYVNQEKKEKHGSVLLQNFKTQAAQKAQEVREAGAQFEEQKRQQEAAKQQKEDLQIQLLTKLAGQTAPNNSGGGFGGFDTNTLLLIGGGALLLMFLTRG